MLLVNKTTYNYNPMTILGYGGTVYVALDSFIGKTIGSHLNKYAGEASLNPQHGVPSGYTPNYTNLPPRTNGQLSSFNNIIGTGTVTTATLGYVDNRVSISARIRVNTCQLLPSDVADAIWDTPLPGPFTGTEAGRIVGSNLLTWLKFLALK